MSLFCHFQGDLNNTVKQIAEAGLNAIVLWGSSSSFRGAHDCELIRDYLDSTLGPFIKNVTIRARKCSEELCNSHGRCFRTDWNYKSKDNDTIYFEQSFNGLLAKILEKILGTMSNTLKGIRRAIELMSFGNHRPKELGQIYSGFGCNCFKGWSGQFCQERQ